MSHWNETFKNSSAYLFFAGLLGLLLNTKQWLLTWYLKNEKKRVLNKQRNNTYLAEASILPYCTTACNYDKYITIITFWRETAPKSLPPRNKGSSQWNIKWFLKTHYNHQSKINITPKRSSQSKIIKFFFRQAGLWMGGPGYWGDFLFELKYVMFFGNTAFNRLIHYLFIG